MISAREIRPRAAAALLALGLWMAAAPRAGAVVPFVLEGRHRELESRVVGEDDAGPVTALDVLFYLQMKRDGRAWIPSGEWLAAEGERAAGSAEEIASAVDEFLAARRLARGVAAPRTPPFVRRNLLYAAGAAAWVEQTVHPQIRMTETDVNRYYLANLENYVEPSRVQVRYIFFPVADTSQFALQRAAEKELGELRDRIVRGTIKFEDAARDSSSAPSAVRGGLIPEFSRGTHFADFEYHAFSLKRPGEISPVFIGHEGAYMLELAGRVEESQVPLAEVEEEIREHLRHEHVRAYFRLQMAELAEKSFSANWAALWQYADLETPVAMLGAIPLARDHVMRVNPGAVNAAYEVQWPIVFSEIGDWIEGEIILRDLEARGLADHRLLARAAAIGEIVLASDEAVARKVDPSRYATKGAAIEALGQGAEGEFGVPQSRIVSISVYPDDEALREVGRRETTLGARDELARSISLGLLPSRPEPTEFARLLTEAARGGGEELTRTIERFNREFEGSGWEDVEVRFVDEGWRDSLPGVAWHPAIVGLMPGRMSGAQTLVENVSYFLAVDERIDRESPWLEAPLAIRVAAYEMEKRRIFEAEVQKVRAARRSSSRVVSGAQ